MPTHSRPGVVATAMGLWRCYRTETRRGGAGRALPATAILSAGDTSLASVALVGARPAQPRPRDRPVGRGPHYWASHSIPFSSANDPSLDADTPSRVARQWRQRAALAAFLVPGRGPPPWPSCPLLAGPAAHDRRPRRGASQVSHLKQKGSTSQKTHREGKLAGREPSGGARPGSAGLDGTLRGQPARPW